MRIRKLFPLVGLLFLLPAGLEAQVSLRKEFFFPQIADGKIDDNQELKTLIVLSNPGDTTARGVLSIFSQNGQPLAFRVRTLRGPSLSQAEISFGGQGAIPFEIPPRAMFQVLTSRSEPNPVVAYGKVTSDVPISGTAIFGEFEVEEDEDEMEVEIKSQAAVEATGTLRKFAVTDFRKNRFEREVNGVEFEFESESATGLAVVNTGTETTTLTLTEMNDFGERVDQTQIVLGPGQHRAFFFWEVLSAPEDMIAGTVIVESSTSDVAAVALKFDDESDEVRKIEFTVAPVVQLAP